MPNRRQYPVVLDIFPLEFTSAARVRFLRLLLLMNIFRRGAPGQAGFSLIELTVVLGIGGILTGMAVIQIGTGREEAKADGAMRVVLSQMNQAREMAITQRRYMQVTFDVASSRVSVIREDTATTTTTMSVVPFEGGVKFVPFILGSDTPDGFGMVTSTTFTSAAGTFPSATGSTSVIKFTPGGTLIDKDGRLANGSVFVAIPTAGLSSRAVTVLGSTGRVRGYRWDGKKWTAV
jgi:prepilin-type N-terminal cleavage/methylation domain-containing protein